MTNIWLFKKLSGRDKTKLIPCKGYNFLTLTPGIFPLSIRMKFIILSTLLSLFSYFSCAQKAHDILIGANADLIKSDNAGFFEKGQGSVEVNYYFNRKFSGTSGVEWWTSDQFSLALGARWFPIDEAYIRIRGLIGEQDLSVGAGWAKPVQGNFRIEAMADLYFSGHIAIRAGIGYVIKRKK